MQKHEQSERTKSEILKTASRLFEENGWDKVTIENIVKEVGVTRGAFYHHFKSREELIFTVLLLSVKNGNPFHNPSLNSSLKEGANALEKLRFMHKYNLQLEIDIAKESDMKKTMYDPVVYKSNVFSFMEVMAADIEKLLVEGNMDGSMSVEYPKHMAQAIVLMCDEFINPMVFKMTKQEYEERLLFLKLFGERLGVPILDDELKKMLIQLHEYCRET